MSQQMDLFATPPAPEASPWPDVLAGLNEAQRRAAEVPADRAVQVLAGAGTGKTELISRRFVKLVRELKERGIHRPEDRILVVTFTKDAALSMRERIHHQLIQAGEEGLSPQAWIGTFHQLAGRLLRTHPLELALPPDFAILNSLEQQVLFGRVMQQVLAGEASDIAEALADHALAGEIPADILSVEQLQASGLEELERLFATERMGPLINRIKTAGLSPREFLEQATRQAERLTERLKSLPMPHDRDRNGVENICMKLEAWRQALADWVHDGWDPVNEAEERILRKGDKPTPGKYKDAHKTICEFYLAGRTFEPLTPDTALLDEQLRIEKLLIRQVTAIYALYQHTLKQEGACDFDDLINSAIRLLEEYPGLKARYRQLYEAIIVDEFQDSNGSQLRLLQALMRENPNITVVGDEKQSIYAFRFAQPENLDLIFRDLPCERVSLQTNYRSIPPVLAVANALTERITQRAHQTLTPCDKHQDKAQPRVVWLDLDARLDTGRVDRQQNPVLAHPPIWEQKDREARFIAVEIARLVSAGEARFEDIAVLVKSHAKAEAIQQVLAEFNIPSIRQKNLGFFQEGVIKDAMALLRLMRSLSDDKALVRILQGKLNHKQIRQLALLKKTLEAGSLFEVCLQLDENPALSEVFPEPLRRALADLARNLLDLKKRHARLSPVQLFHQLAARVGIIDPAAPEWLKKQQRTTLRTLEKMLTLFGQNRPLMPTLDEVIETLERYRDNPQQELPVSEVMSGEDAVKIMTVFAAKGLEFPVVFAAYTEVARSARSEDTTLLFDPQYAGKAGFGLMLGRTGKKASLKKELYQAAWQKCRSRTEQQRIFYVALTRAEERLYVIRCGQSEDWTAPGEYPASAMTRLSQTDDEDLLEREYWMADPAEIRERMDRLHQPAP